MAALSQILKEKTVVVTEHYGGLIVCSKTLAKRKSNNGRSTIIRLESSSSRVSDYQYLISKNYHSKLNLSSGGQIRNSASHVFFCGEVELRTFRRGEY